MVATLLAGVLLALAGRAFAVEPSERLANPQLEARAESIGRTLRCMVCQNESIEESNAGLAHDIRLLVRQLLLQGDTDAQVRGAIVGRYGEFVLLKPPVQPATYVLWFGPPALLVLGLAGTVVWLRRRPAAAKAPVPLTPQEASRLDTLLREADDVGGRIGSDQDAWRVRDGVARGQDTVARGEAAMARGEDVDGGPSPAMTLEGRADARNHT